jgi:hypothetical protein
MPQTMKAELLTQRASKMAVSVNSVQARIESLSFLQTLIEPFSPSVEIDNSSSLSEFHRKY